MCRMFTAGLCRADFLLHLGNYQKHDQAFQNVESDRYQAVKYDTHIIQADLLKVLLKAAVVDTKILSEMWTLEVN